MRIGVIVSLVVLAAACGGGKAPVPYEQIAASEAVQVLKTPDNPFGVIYHPAVDLAKRPAGR